MNKFHYTYTLRASLRIWAFDFLYSLAFLLRAFVKGRLVKV